MYIFYAFYNIDNVYIVCLCVYIYTCIIQIYMCYVVHICVLFAGIYNTYIRIGPQGSPLYRSTVAGAFSGTAGAEKVVVVPLVDEQRGISQITN